MLHSIVIEKIREMLVSGELQPKTRINEKKLCAKFGISRTPLREALKSLSIEGLITLMPNRGAWVTEISNEDMINLFRLMGALESLAAELVVERATNEEIDFICEMTEKLIVSYNEKDTHSYYAINKKIHSAIVDFSRNEHLKQIYMITAAKINQVRFLIPITKEGWALALLEHESMANAFKRRDKESISLIMKKHLDTKINITVKSVEVLNTNNS